MVWAYYKVVNPNTKQSIMVLARSRFEAEKHAMEDHGLIGDAFKVPDDLLTKGMKEGIKKRNDVGAIQSSD